MSFMGKPARRISQALLRAAFGLKEGQTVGSVSVQTGRVKKFEGEGDYWEVDNGSLIVAVQLDDGRELWCECGPWSGGTSGGLFMLPNEGDEAIVGFPAGDETDGYLMQTYAVGDGDGTPGDLQPGRAVLMASEVYIYSGDGASVERVVTENGFAQHVHPTGVGPSGTPTNASLPTTYSKVLKTEPG